MDKKSSISAARAISSTLIDRYLLKLVSVITVVILCIVILSLLLAAMHSGWWLILTLITLPIALIASSLTTIVWLVAQKIAPRRLLRREKQQINQFVDEFSLKLVAAKAIQRTPLGIASLVVWTWIKGKGNSSVQEIITKPIKEVKDLKTKFFDIAELFA